VQPPRTLPTLKSGPVTPSLAGYIALWGTWQCKTQEELFLKFNVDKTVEYPSGSGIYEVRKGVVRVTTSAGTTDYPYSIHEGTLSLLYPNGMTLAYARTSSARSSMQPRSAPPGNQRGNASGAPPPVVSSVNIYGLFCDEATSAGAGVYVNTSRQFTFYGNGRFQLRIFTSGMSSMYGSSSSDEQVVDGTYTIDNGIILLQDDQGSIELYSLSGVNSGYVTALKKDDGTEIIRCQ
jgi:hypothetical protein